MPLGIELAGLFRRDLTRLKQELEALPSDELLWGVLPGATNSIGNLALHLEGNLMEFIGRELGGFAFVRNRPREFDSRGLPRVELIARVQNLIDRIPPVIAGLSDERLEGPYPDQTMVTRQFLIHLAGHFSYHLGQIDYLRRIQTAGAAIQFANL